MRELNNVCKDISSYLCASKTEYECLRKQKESY